MRMLAWLGLTVAFAIPQGTGGPKPTGCDPLGNVQFVCGLVGPEDLVVVPGSDWVIASGDAAPGAITLVSVRDKAITALYPSPAIKQRLDSKTYDSCPGPIDPEEKDKFRAHGLALRPGRNALHTLYVVHHGNRESIEVFEFDARAKALTWIGCAVAPEPVGLNSVVASARRRLRIDEFSAARRGQWARQHGGGREERRAVGMAHGDRVEHRPGQRGIGSQWDRDLERRQVVLHGGMGQSDVHPVLARADAGQAR